MSTALVIGLGTSGLRIIEECQQFHYQFTAGKNRPDSVRYLYLETDLSQEPETTAKGETDIKPVYISLKDMAAGLRQMGNDGRLDTSWMPSPDAALANGDGAGGLSSYGRLALWLNYSSVRHEVLTAWQEIQGDANTYVFLLGTLTGGTGSGTCVDMAYMVREITGSDNVFGLFLTPCREQLGKNGSDPLFYNYFSAITALEYYTEERNVYDVVMPDGHKVHDPRSPFKQCYVISQNYTANFPPMQSVSDLYKVAGLHLFSRIYYMGAVDTLSGQPIQNFSELISSKLIDLQANNNTYKFSTFGTKLIYYPKELLKEYLGAELSEKELHKWIDPSSFSDGIQNYSLQQSDSLKGAIRRVFDEIAPECMNIVDGAKTYNGISLKKEVCEDDVDTIMMKTYKENDAKTYIYGLFSTRRDKNYFVLLKNNQVDIRKKFVSEIYKLFCENINRYQNLIVGRDIILTSVVDSINSILDFWSSEYKVDGDDNKWDGIVQQYIALLMDEKTIPTLLTLKRKYFVEKLSNLLTLAKMHMSVDVLVGIKDAIQTGLTTIQGTHNGKTVVLPTKKMVGDIINMVQNVIGSESTNQRGMDKTLVRRKGEIKSRVMSNTPNFSAIFSKGGMNEDLDEMRRDENALKFNYQVISRGMDLWSYLERVKAKKLYEDALIMGTDFVNTNIVNLQNNDISVLVRNLKEIPGDSQWQAIKVFFTGNENNIKDKMPGMEFLRANYDKFQGNNNLPLIFVSSDLNVLKDVMDGGYDITAPAHGCELAELKDAIIVYQEYGTMGNNELSFRPSRNIDINQVVRQRIRSNYNEQDTVADSPNVFLYKRRVPYISSEDFVKYLKEEE